VKGLLYPKLFQSLYTPNISQFEQYNLEDAFDDDFMSETSTKTKKEEESTGNSDDNSVLSLDGAILESIARIERPEMKQKLFSTILLIGGSSLFDGLVERLEDKIFEQLPTSVDIDRVEVLVNRKDTDPRFLSWKGGAILTSLEVTKELWIKATDWSIGGMRCLKDKALFEFS